MTYKELLAFIAIALTFIGFLPYIRSIIVGTVRPHLFSWVIWGSVTIFVFLHKFMMVVAQEHGQWALQE